MKVAIVTLTGYFNFGNRLQNYACQEVLKSIGLEVETIPIEARSIKRNIKNIIGLITDKVPYINNYRLNEITKEYRFYKFTRKNIKYSNNNLCSINDVKTVESLDKNYDYFITGSDQVFNPYFGDIDIFYLSFVPSNKRLAYAASFGISNMPLEYQSKVRELLYDFKALSVREDSGRTIIEELTEREATILVDPTMMLNKNQWLDISNKPRFFPNKKYILTYVLGNETVEFKEFVEKISLDRNLEVINILDKKNKYTYTINPSEFIYLINNAEVMITDSFHGAVFSILMQTPFVIFERQDSNMSMNSRIETLVSTFKMESRLSGNINTVDDVFNINFEHVEDILEYERNKTIQYLKKAFEIEK